MSLPRLSDLIADNPVHRSIITLQDAVKGARSDIRAMASALRMESPPRTSVYVPPKPSSPTVAKSSPQSDPLEIPTEEDTKIELKNRLLEQIADAEDDLEHGMKIRSSNGAMLCCSCLNGKHDVKIKAKCLELMPKESSNPIYRNIYNWFETNKDKLTASACKTGQYTEEYIKMANELGNFRRQLQKELMGTQYDSSSVKSVKDFLKDKGGIEK